MSDQEKLPNNLPPHPQAFSISRILMVVVPVALIMGGYYLSQQSKSATTKKQLQDEQLTRLLGAASEQKPLAGWKDEDGDLLADCPEADQCVAPERLVFSYVASEESKEKELAIWQPMLDFIAEKTGIETGYVKYETVDKQLAALADGKLHVTAVNTGAVPEAVKTAGFIPMCTYGNEEGFGYKMHLLVKADSPAKKATDLRGKRITFVRPNSNSGFKAPFLFLMNEHQMLPERDYDCRFSMGHDISVLALIKGDTDAVPVASDLFDRMVRKGEVEKDAVRVIHESETFPPVAIGYAYNLAPSTREAIGQSFLEFDWEGSTIAESYGASGADRFVPVDYKDHWAIIRRINDQIEAARKAL